MTPEVPKIETDVREEARPRADDSSYLEPEALSMVRGTVQGCELVRDALASANLVKRYRFNNANSFGEFRTALTDLLGIEGLEEAAPIFEEKFSQVFCGDGSRIKELFEEHPEYASVALNAGTRAHKFIKSLGVENNSPLP